VFFFAVENVGGFEAAKALFENNVINWLVLVVAIVFLWNKYVPPMFKAREEHIENALKEAALAKKQGQELFQEQKKRVENAEAEKKQILAEARELAEQLKQQMQAQALKDMRDLEAKIEQQILNDRQLAITQLRQTAALASIKLTEQLLPSLLDEQAKAKLLTQFMEQLDSVSGQKDFFSPNRLESSRK
jgi:F-type H+-transporting ATPase subunit b